MKKHFSGRTYIGDKKITKNTMGNISLGQGEDVGSSFTGCISVVKLLSKPIDTTGKTITFNLTGLRKEES